MYLAKIGIELQTRASRAYVTRDPSKGHFQDFQSSNALHVHVYLMTSIFTLLSLYHVSPLNTSYGP